MKDEAMKYVMKSWDPPPPPKKKREGNGVSCREKNEVTPFGNETLSVLEAMW